MIQITLCIDLQIKQLIRLVSIERLQEFVLSLINLIPAALLLTRILFSRTQAKMWYWLRSVDETVQNK